jgi:hypothetical protein
MSLTSTASALASRQADPAAPAIVVPINGRIVGDVTANPEAQFWGIVDPDNWPAGHPEQTIRKFTITSNKPEATFEVKKVSTDLADVTVTSSPVVTGKTYEVTATLLKARGAPKDWLTRFMDVMFGGFFRGFNRLFRTSSENYGRGVGGLLSRKSIAVAVYLVLLGATYAGFNHVPSGFIPTQDKQYLVSFAQLPDGATLDRTEDVIREMSSIALKEEGVEGAVAFPGLSINGFINSSSAGIVFVTLKPFNERTSSDLSGLAISQKLQQKFAGVKGAFIAVFPPPEQKQIRLQFAATLKAVVSQRLVRRADDKGRVPAVEVMIATGYIRDCIINADKTRLIHDAIAAGTSQYGMQTFDQSLFDLYTKQLITLDEALARASNADEFKLRIQGIRSASDAAREEMASQMADFERFARK